METWEYQLAVAWLQKTAEVVCESKQLRTYPYLRARAIVKLLDHPGMLKTA